MMNKYTQLKAEWEFKREVKSRLIQPGQCKSATQLRKCMEELHYLINDIKKKYKFVPKGASVLFEKYNNMHEKLIYQQISQQNIL